MWYRARAALARVRELLQPRARMLAEQDEEFTFHLEMETAENVRRGMAPDEARRAAVLRFGGRQRFREETNDARGIVALDALVRDARVAVRRLRRAPTFAAGVIATLGIGIGAAVGIGTIVYGVLLRDLPYAKPDQLVRVGFVTDGEGTPGDFHSATTYFHFATAARSFAELGAYTTDDTFVITDGDASERVVMASMTPSTLTLLGARPILGQLFERGDTSWSTGRTPVLISENLWRRRYGADPKIVGRQIAINRGERTIIGVLPRSFAFPSASVDLYYPAPVPVGRPQIASRTSNVVGRLREGVSASAAQAELSSLLPSIAERFPAITPAMLESSRARVVVQSLKSATVDAVRPQVVLLGVLVGVVLLIATSNVMNLMLLRTERIRHEIAIALSLGAGRSALARRFVVESTVFGLTSTAVAVPVAAVVLSTKFGFTEREIPRLHEVSFSIGTVALVLASALAIGVAVGLITLARTGTIAVFDSLRAVRSTSSRAWRRAQGGLVAFQVALALMLLVAAGLLGRSFWNLRTAQIGFEPENAMTFQVSLPWGPTGYTAYEKSAGFSAKMVDRLVALPGVSSAGVALRVPLASRGAPLTEQLRAADEPGREVITAGGNVASAEYFRTMGIPLRAGRGFRPGDLRGTPAVIVSERLAMTLFGRTDVIGRNVARLTRANAAPSVFTIVGVAGDVHWERIEDGYVPMVYFPLLRDGDGLAADSIPVPYKPMDVQYAIRGVQLPTASMIHAIARDIDPRVPPTNLRTLESLVDDATARVRLTMLLIGVAGVAALLLGVIGVYSVVSYVADGRTREFGIRLALGAAPTRVGRMVLQDGFRLVAIGIASGLLAALGATRFLRALLYEVTPTSAVEFGMATAFLVAVTLVATLIPARRAARTHPAVVLRGE